MSSKFNGHRARLVVRIVTRHGPSGVLWRHCNQAPLDDPAEAQIIIRLLRAAGAADQPIVDGPRKKIRKTGASMYSVDCVEFWERIANQLLFLKHRDADSMWSLLIRYNPATKVLMKTLNLSDAI